MSLFGKSHNASQSATTSEDATTEKEPYTRRKLLKDGAILTGAFLTGLGIREWRKAGITTGVREEYGRLETPHYLVDENFSYREGGNYRDFYRGTDAFTSASKPGTQELQLQLTKTEVAKLAEVLQEHSAAVQESLKGKLGSGAEARFLVSRDHPAFTSALRRLEEIDVSLMSKSMELLFNEANHTGDRVDERIKAFGGARINQAVEGKGYRELVAEYGEPDAFVRGIVKSVTGKNLPKDVSFEVRDIDKENVMGYANFIDQEIVTEDAHFARVLLVNAHEAGHLMALHSEEEFAGTTDRGSAEISNWEEACAYAFEYVALQSLEDDALFTVAEAHYYQYRKNMLDEYYSGKNTTECHRVGMAYFDAALTVLGSPAKAYNYLATHTELTQEMKDVIRENRTMKKRFDNNFSHDNRDVEETLAQLQAEVKKLQEDYGL